MINNTLEQTNKLVVYLGHDASSRRELGRTLAEQGLRLRSVENPSEFSAVVRGDPPAVLILELALTPKATSLAAYLSDLLGDATPSLICIAEQDDIEHRLRALRAGAKAFFTAPLDTAALATKVIQVHGLSNQPPYRILLVEQEPAQAQYLAMLLTNAGMHVRTVSDALAVLSAMTEFRPDLVLMDLLMPAASGAELTAIIRDHDQFYDIPILLLSDDDDADQQLNALSTGGDGVIAAPIQRQHLIAAVEHRIRLTHGQRERRITISKRPAPSGIFDKDSFMRRLEGVVREDSAQGPGNGVLIVEIDARQQIMDRLGLSGTEKFLSHIEDTLGRQLTATDAATRLGEFTYAVLARRNDRAALTELGKKLQRIVAAPTAELGTVHSVTTASIGIGLFQPPPEDALGMLARAEQACATARQNGGNRVEVWLPQGERSEATIGELIQQALKTAGFMLLFQPIPALGQSPGLHYEVQLRLRAPDGELLAPRQFFPVAERCGLMTAIDRWVMERALNTLHDHRIRHPDLRLLVHQGIATIREKDWLLWLRDQIARRELTGIRPILQFQINDVRQAADVARVIFGLFRKAGIHVCISNVTNSPSEIELIGRLGATMVKLSFHTLANTDLNDLTALVHHLHDRNALVIAAGIENQDTVSRVWSCGTDFIQGNYIQMASEDIVASAHDAN